MILYVRHRLPRSSVTDAATDVINLPLNEDCCYSKPLSVLACGVGDPRNVLLSLCNLSETYEEELTFVLDDICACTLARTVLILYTFLRVSVVLQDISVSNCKLNCYARFLLICLVHLR